MGYRLFYQIILAKRFAGVAACAAGHKTDNNSISPGLIALAFFLMGYFPLVKPGFIREGERGQNRLLDRYCRALFVLDVKVIEQSDRAVARDYLKRIYRI